MAKQPDVIIVDKEKKEDNSNSVAAAASVVNTGIKELGGIIKEFEKIAISSPLASCILSIIILDVLHKQKVISDNAYTVAFIIIGSASAVSIAGDILGELTSVTDLVGTRAAPPSLLTNSVSTLVTTEAQNQDQLNALLGMLSKKT